METNLNAPLNTTIMPHAWIIVFTRIEANCRKVAWRQFPKQHKELSAICSRCTERSLMMPISGNTDTPGCTEEIIH